MQNITPVGNLVYLGSPYTHKNIAQREARFIEVVFCCAWLMNHMKNKCFYSPIANAHPIATRCSLPGEWEFWADFDECILSRCDEMWILCIPGWTKSTGVKTERQISEKFNIPIRFVILNPEQSADSPERYTLTDTEPEDPYQTGFGNYYS